MIGNTMVFTHTGESLAIVGGAQPWAGGPGLYNKASWKSHVEQSSQ